MLSVLELSDGEEEKKAAKRSGGRPSRARGAPKLWRSLRERLLWRVDLAAAATVPRVAYCAIVLGVRPDSEHAAACVLLLRQLLELSCWSSSRYDMTRQVVVWLQH